jgi:hypothetical protein
VLLTITRDRFYRRRLVAPMSGAMALDERQRQTLRAFALTAAGSTNIAATDLHAQAWQGRVWRGKAWRGMRSDAKQSDMLHE